MFTPCLPNGLTGGRFSGAEYREPASVCQQQLAARCGNKLDREIKDFVGAVNE